MHTHRICFRFIFGDALMQPDNFFWYSNIYLILCYYVMEMRKSNCKLNPAPFFSLARAHARTHVVQQRISINHSQCQIQCCRCLCHQHHHYHCRCHHNRPPSPSFNPFSFARSFLFSSMYKPIHIDLIK